MNALSLFNDWFGTTGYEPATYSKGFIPNVDVTQTKESYILNMDLPGKNETNVDLELNDKVLTISSKQEECKSEPENTEKTQFLLRERHCSSFKRTFTLPSDINEEEVSASFKDGVLNIIIPRKSQTACRKIQIQGA